MIYEQLARLPLYRSLSPLLAKGIDFAIANSTNANLPVGRIEIAGDDVFGVVHAYDTKPLAECRWEAHRRYIDIQVMLTGSERMDVADVAKCSAETPYDPQKDFIFFGGASEHQALVVPTGYAAIFFPHDAHRPGITATEAGNATAIRKLIIKIRAH